MERIGSNPYFNPAHLYQQNQANKAAAQPKPESLVAAASEVKSSNEEAVRDYASLFDDKELEKLQKNLESIANLAESTLKRINS